MWRGLFDVRTIEKGNRICNYCICKMTISEEEITAEVDGSYIYDVRISKKLKMSCSCPQATYYGICKHLAGVLLKNDENRSNGLEALDFDYSEQDERLTEIASQTNAYIKQREEERERAKQERARKKAEELENCKRAREEAARLERERREAEREAVRRARQEAENAQRRTKLLEKLSILDLPNLDSYTTDQLKSLLLEKQTEITAKRLETQQREKEARAKARQEQLQREREERERQRVIAAEREATRRYKELKKKRSQITPLTINDEGKTTLIAGNYYCFAGQPNQLSVHAFGSSCKAICSSGFFIPMGLVKQFHGKYCVWYTDFNAKSNKYHYGQEWSDQINDDGNCIERTYLSNRQDLLTEKDLAGEETYFLVFGRENDLYKFHGTFAIERTIEKSPLTIIYRKLNSKFTFKWPTITPIDIALEPTYEELAYEAKHKKR